jgi:hypothetical protein
LIELVEIRLRAVELIERVGEIGIVVIGHA